MKVAPTRRAKRFREQLVSFSVGIPVRGRGPSRLRGCLRGLRAQEALPSRILVVEQSNSPTDLKRVCADEGAGYLRLPDDEGPFNKAWLSNVAARYLRRTGTHFVNVDIDAILGASALAGLAAALADDPARALSIRPRRLPRMISYLDQTWAELVRRSQDWGDSKSWGMCLTHRFEELEELRGFDEAFVGWGSEDVNYALRSKARMVDLGRVLLHQWHPPASRAYAARNQKLASLPNSNSTAWGSAPLVLDYVAPPPVVGRPWDG